MTRGAFVVDNSVVMSWCFEDESSPYSEAALDALRTRRAVVPALWAYEAANVLAVAVRKRRLKRGDAQKIAEMLGRLPIEISSTPDRASIAALFALAQEAGLSAYDAAYLELARRESLPIATADSKLRKAARAAGILLFEPAGEEGAG